MTWYYADNGRQIGPVEESALDELVQAGVVRDDTLVWHDGMPNWQAHRVVRGVRPPPPPPVPVPAVPVASGPYGAAPAPASPYAGDTAFCSECGRPYPTSQLLNLGSASVCAQCKPLYLQRVREGGQSIGTRRYGGFWIRFVAIVIDGIIIGVVNLILTVPLRLTAAFSAMSDPATILSAGLGMLGLSVMISIVLSVAYNGFFVSRYGATPGKMALGLKIIRSDGSGISFGRAVGRYFAQMLSGMILYIGFIIAGFDTEKRALHDHIVDTRVIYAR